MSETVENNAAGSESYQCSNCGAALKYKPGTSSLHCDYCGADTPIDVEVVKEVEEFDFEEYAGQLEKLNTETTKVIGCRKCGAESTFDESLKSVECPYCNTPLIESDAHEERLIKPSYLLPFKVTNDEVPGFMTNWLKKRWFAPNKLKSQAIYSNKLQGVYIPCWTYDAQTETDYQGERGDDYTVTVGSGKNRRTETRTRWSYASGHLSIFFDDVMVPASKMIKSDVINKVSNWDTMNMVEADNRFLSGFITEKYVMNMLDGYNIAKNSMESSIQYSIKQDIGGNRQRISSSKTFFNDIKFKLILLPMYMSSYTYGDKLYHFFINGRTGNVTGDRPYSIIKIALAIIVGLILVILFLKYANR